MYKLKRVHMFEATDGVVFKDELEALEYQIKLDTRNKLDILIMHKTAFTENERKYITTFILTHKNALIKILLGTEE